MKGFGERPTVPLEAFLSRLPTEEAAEARAAAGQIDALERRIGPPGWFERNLVGFGLGALVLFTAGLVLLALRASGLIHFAGPDLVVPLLAAFPALVLAYLWSVRGRTRLDHEKMALNERHFLPHGGAYFGAREGRRTVTRVTPPGQDAPEDAPTLKERTEALHARATRGRRSLW